MIIRRFLMLFALVTVGSVALPTTTFAAPAAGHKAAAKKKPKAKKASSTDATKTDKSKAAKDRGFEL